MKRTLLALIFVLALGAIASAQETYSLPANATQTADLRTYVLGVNRGMCRKAGFPTGVCTQAQACTAAGISSACTAAQARAADARIWPDTQAGREEFVTYQWVLPKFVEARATLRTSQQAELCEWWKTASTANKNTICTTSGLATGCEICAE